MTTPTTMQSESESCRWQITGELGRGSYGSVYCMMFSPSGLQSNTKKFALKVLEQTGGNAQDTEEACKELRIMGGLSHPSIVALVDAFQLDHRLLLTLELCQGGDLRSFLDNLKAKRQPKTFQPSGVEEPLAVRWTQQLASGLQYMHQKKILHRDLKPQNIFLKDKFTLKIGDLGIARQLVFTKEMAATHIGTPLYISPEIYQGNSYNYKTDVWSLGCCIYEMLTLEYAFHAPSRFELVGKVVNKQVLPLPRCYSHPLQTLVLSMLHKDPDDRPSASHLLRSVQKMDGANPQPQEQEDLDASRSQKPRDSRSLQLWRQEMAQALNTFLTKKWAAQSAQLAAAMGQKVSLASIRDIDGSGSAKDRQRERRKVPGSKLGASTISDDNNEASGSLLLSSEQDTVSSDESPGTLSSSQNSAKAAVSVSLSHTTQTDTRKTQRSAGRVRTKAKHRLHFLGRQGKQNNKNGHIQSHSNLGDTDLDTRDAGFSEASVQPKHIQIGKASIVIKSRPLPYPKVSRDIADSGDLTELSTDQSDGDVRPLQYTDLSDNSSQIKRDGSNSGGGSQSSTDNTTSNSDSSQPGDSTLDSSGHISTFHSHFSQSARHHHSSTSYSNIQQQQHRSNESPVSGDTLETHKVYAKEVIEQVRGKLLTLAPLSVRAANGPDDGGDRAQGSREESRDRNKGVQAEGQKEEINEESRAQGKKPRVKKKRNFLKEKINKEENYPKNSAIKAAPTQVEEKEKPKVTLFTRAQRVTFSNLQDDQLDLNGDLDRLEPMAREVGVQNLRAAVSTAVLLAQNPALLQFQLRELLGRENYKKHAADIVDTATGKQSP